LPFTFPQYHNQSSRRQYPGMTMPDRDSKPATIKTILVLDDDVLVRMPVVQFLRDCGYHVVEAASTDEAIAILQNTNTPVDVVLSEIDIPGSMNGFGFAQWARSVRPELQILLAGTTERTVRNAAELCPIENDTQDNQNDYNSPNERVAAPCTSAVSTSGGRAVSARHKSMLLSLLLPKLNGPMVLTFQRQLGAAAILSTVVSGPVPPR
jgi:CheY-like chemotaxis protein